MQFNRTSRCGLVLAVLVLLAVAAPLLVRQLQSYRAAASYARGTQLAAAQIPLDARAAYLEAIRLDPGYAPPYRSLGEMAAAQRFFDVSVPYWKDYLAREPKAKHARCQLAYSELMAGLEVPALRDAESELESDSGCPQAHLIAGVLYARKSESKRALDHLAVAAQSYAGRLQVQLVYARVLALSGDYDRAVPILLQILAKDRSHAEPFLWLGYIYVRRASTPENASRAETYLRQALDLQPEYTEANVELARLLLGQHRPAQALPYAQKAAASQRHNPAALYLLSQVYQGLGRTTEAAHTQADFRRESDLAAHQKALMRQYTSGQDDSATAFALGKVLLQREQPEAALVFLRDAARRAPGDPRAQAAVQQAERLASAVHTGLEASGAFVAAEGTSSLPREKSKANGAAATPR